MKHRYLAKKYWDLASTPMGRCAIMGREYKDLINFSLGDPDFTTDEKIINAAFEDAKSGHTHYTNYFGDGELIEEICNYYKETYNYDTKPEECLIVAGGLQGMYLSLEAILDPDDEVIFHEPCFTPYPNVVRLAGGKPVVLETYEEEEFQVDTERLKSLITNRTKALMINTPNNPTGACFNKKTFEDVAKVAIENDLIVIADDIYDLFSYAEPFLPITTLEGMKERTVTIGSFSKDYAMTGWRVGYTLAPEFIIKTMEKINECNVFCAPSISQRAGLHALRMRREVQPAMLEEFKKRAFYAYERINSTPNMSILPPRGSIYLFINIRKTGLTSMEAFDRILSEAHVLVLPGIGFGACGEGYIRIALSVGVDKIKEAFDRISKMEIFT